MQQKLGALVPGKYEVVGTEKDEISLRHVEGGNVEKIPRRNFGNI